jgi:hypothetical protein
MSWFNPLNNDRYLLWQFIFFNGLTSAAVQPTSMPDPVAEYFLEGHTHGRNDYSLVDPFLTLAHRASILKLETYQKSIHPSPSFIRQTS